MTDQMNGASRDSVKQVGRLGRGLGRLIPVGKPRVSDSPPIVEIEQQSKPEVGRAGAVGTASPSSTGRGAGVSSGFGGVELAGGRPSGQPLPAAVAGLTVVEVSIDRIVGNVRQPRTEFDENAIKSLAASIQANGLLQPILLRRMAGQSERYELVAGERRWRAFKSLGKATIPSIIQQATDSEAAVRSLVENIQREDLNPMDRAFALRRLIDDFGKTQADVAQVVGLDRTSVTNLVRLCDLDPWTAGCVRSGTLSQGHAKALLAVGDSNMRKAVAQRAITESWSVRSLEREVQRLAAPATPNPRLGAATHVTSAHIADLERRISATIGAKVSIRTGRKKGTGTLSIDFGSNEQFEGLLERLGFTNDVQ